jgi:hypothetical protein
MFSALELSGYCQATAVHAALGRWRWVTHTHTAKLLCKPVVVAVVVIAVAVAAVAVMVAASSRARRRWSRLQKWTGSKNVLDGTLIALLHTCARQTVFQEAGLLRALRQKRSLARPTLHAR